MRPWRISDINPLRRIDETWSADVVKEPANDEAFAQHARWQYEPDERPKKKHAWNRPEPGFVGRGASLVGKCPNNVTEQEAEELLNGGVPMRSERSRNLWPSRIYLIHEGQVYRAVPTNPGRSYHAFPELPRSFRELPRATKIAVLDRARDLGCLEEVRRWMST